MNENEIIFYEILLIWVVLTCFIFYYFFYKNRKTTYTQTEDIDEPKSRNPLGLLVEKLRFEKIRERIEAAQKILKSNNHSFEYIIDIPDDFELIETETSLLINGSEKSIGEICDDIALRNEMHEGFCMQLGDWRFFVIDDIAQSDIENKTIVMPPYHWLFLSCKFRDSIPGYDIHPFHYFYEPMTFKRVFDYGIGVEATDLTVEED